MQAKSTAVAELDTWLPSCSRILSSLRAVDLFSRSASAWSAAKRFSGRTSQKWKAGQGGRGRGWR